MDVECCTVCVGTYGEPRWLAMAYQRAIPSAEAEGVEVIHRHAHTLAKARNEALRLVDTEFAIFLDADDSLEPGYVEAMVQGSADLRAPLVRYVRDGVEQGAAYPRVVGHHHLCRAECLEAGNWIAIGACVRVALLREVGGFGEEPIWEDWSAWLRCYRAGASVEGTEAIYRAYVSGRGRNATLSEAERLRVFAEIAA